MLIHRLIAAGLLLSTLTLTLLRWGLLWLVVYDASRQQGRSVWEGLKMGSAEFQDGFSTALDRILQPRSLLFGSDAVGLALMAGSALVVAGFWLWDRSKLSSEPLWAQLLYGLLATLPILVGLALVPGHIRRVFATLAAAGLGTPGLIGSGIGESFAPVVTGTGLGAALLVVFLGLSWRPREQRNPWAEGDF